MNLHEMFESSVVTADPASSIQSVAQKMKDENVGAVVVVEDGKVAGIVTDRDMALSLASGNATTESPVEQIMTRKVVTIWDDQGIFNATQYFLGHKIRRLPIIDREDRLVGMITLDDMMSLLARELFNATQALEPALAAKSF